jgi:hypothetical protein
MVVDQPMECVIYEGRCDPHHAGKINCVAGAILRLIKPSRQRATNRARGATSRHGDDRAESESSGARRVGRARRNGSHVRQTKSTSQRIRSLAHIARPSNVGRVAVVGSRSGPRASGVWRVGQTTLRRRPILDERTYSRRKWAKTPASSGHITLSTRGGGA